MSAVIEARDVVRRYAGGFEAVRGVDLTVAAGELFALLGTNGAGKTSTLEVIEGLASPTSGAVRVLGHDPVADRRLVRPRMGIMLQEGGFPSDLTVAETARMWAGTLSVPRPVSEALDMVDMNGRASVVVKQLSGGERRRLDLALALLGRPEVLFLDEPTTGLDPESRRRAWELIRRLRDDGTAIVLTTHYLDEAQDLADHLAIMHDGQIVASGTVADVIAGHPSRIDVDTPAVPLPDLVGALPAELGSTLRVDEIRPGTVSVRTHDLQATLTDLLTWAAERSITLSGLHASTATLESVFLTIAGNAHTEGVLQ